MLNIDASLVQICSQALSTLHTAIISAGNLLQTAIEQWKFQQRFRFGIKIPRADPAIACCIQEVLLTSCLPLKCFWWIAWTCYRCKTGPTSQLVSSSSLQSVGLCIVAQAILDMFLMCILITAAGQGQFYVTLPCCLGLVLPCLKQCKACIKAVKLVTISKSHCKPCLSCIDSVLRHQT